MPSLSSLQVTEIFHSIQGESTRVGLPCVFVRLTGCPLRCTWCDTEYAFHGGETMDMGTILEQVRSYGCSLVEVTGGEPLHQQGSLVLLTKLCDAGYQVMIETSGTFDISAIDNRVSIIMDVKCPGSGMMDRMMWSNLEHLSQKDEIKFVLEDRSDYEWAKDIIVQYGLENQCPVLLSPVFGSLDLQPLAGWILSDRLRVRIQAQLHKFIWDPKARGV